METQVPPLDQTKKLLLNAGWSEDKIKAETEKTNKAYGGSIKDPAFLLWLVATQNGVDAGAIKAETQQRGTELRLADATEARGRSEMDLDQKERGMYAIEGVVMNLQTGKSSKDKDKVSFMLYDPTGRHSVTCWGDAVALVMNARIQDGDYVEIPQASFFGRLMEARNPGEEDKWWQTLSIPPFGGIRKIDKPIESVFKDVEGDAVKEGDPVFVHGIPTNCQKKEQDAGANCGRWIMEGKEDQHANCGDEEVVKQVNYDLTIACLTGQIYKVRTNHRQPKPVFPLPKGQTMKVYGTWNKNQLINVAAIRIVKAGAKEASPMPEAPAAAPAPAPAPAAAPKEEKPKAAPKPAAKPKEAPAPAPAPAQAEETPAEEETSVLGHPAFPDDTGIPEAVLRTFRTMTKDYGGTNRRLVLVNSCVASKAVVSQIPLEDGDSDLPPDKLKEVLRRRVDGYVADAVALNILKFEDEEKRVVKWIYETA